MSNGAKARTVADAMSARLAESDILHFLARTLRAHVVDAQPKDVLVKLQNLKHALEQQEITLADWPESPSRDRICAALAKAKFAVAQIVDDLHEEPDQNPAAAVTRAV